MPDLVDLSPDQVALKEAVRRFARDRVAPLAADVDRHNAWPEDLWKEIVALGIIGVAFPEEEGGGGGTYLDFALMIEELARASAAVALMPVLNVIVGAAVQRYGTDEARAAYLPGLLSGELKACWAFTEPATGSDPKAIETRATETGTGWTITGTKAFISHSSVADVGVIFARTGERISAILVDTHQPGFQPGARYDLLGLRGADTGDLVLDGVEAPTANLLGNAGDGMRILVAIESEAKVRASAMCVGMAQAALDESIAYGLNRLHRGQPLADKFPTTAALIADIAVEVEAARWLTYHTASRRTVPATPEFDRLAATCKLAASRAARQASNLAMQVHGAYGYTAEFPVSRIYRDAKAYEMIQGTAEIQRVIVAKALLDEHRRTHG